MKNYSFHWELKNLIVQFMKALDDGVIKRYNEDRIEQGDNVAVKVVYSPKSRTLQNLVNKQQNLELPVISVSLGGIARNPQRVFNKIYGPTFTDQPLTSPLQPVPIDITINVSILTKYQNDMDQIISNIIPYFDPYIMVSWKHPDMTQEIRSKVNWSGNLNYNYPADLGATVPYRQAVDTTFVMQGWLFKKADANSGIIHNVITDYIGVADLSEIELNYLESSDYDRFITSGIPIVSEVKPINIEESKNVTLYFSGNMLDRADSVYISGSMFPQTTANYVDMFSSSPRLSANNPPFYGTPVLSFETIGNAMAVSIDSINETGLIDIIVMNQAGYGGVIKNSKLTDLWRCGISVYHTINTNAENVTFSTGDVGTPTTTMTYTQMTPLLITDNPVNYRYFTPIYRSSDAVSGVDYSQSVFGDLQDLSLSVNQNQYLSIDVSGSTYYVPIYAELISEIIVGTAGIKINGTVCTIAGELISAGYIGFNYGNAPAYVQIYSLNV